MISLLGGSISNPLYLDSWTYGCDDCQAVESHHGNYNHILKGNHYNMYMIADIAVVPFSGEYFILRSSEVDVSTKLKLRPVKQFSF